MITTRTRHEKEDACRKYRFRLDEAQGHRCISCKNYVAGSPINCRQLSINICNPLRSRCPLYEPGTGTVMELQEIDEAAYPYVGDFIGGFDFGEHEDTRPPRFKTWAEAIGAQIRYNKELKGHKARRRRKGERARPAR